MVSKKNLANLLAMSFIVSSCSHIRSIDSSPRNIASSTNANSSPTAIMNEFVAVEREKELQNILSEKVSEERPNFLRPVNNDVVQMWVKYFSTRGKERFERYMQNGETYRPLIEEILDDHGLPRELYFVGLIESGYYLQAKSTASAVGPWQFIKGTGLRYGLKVQNGVDERKNIAKATKAAALYFQDLYNIFGSWELALSAYNAGEYGVIRRIRGAQTRDFYELSEMKKLPKETRHYVPKVLAAMEVYNNHTKYGVKYPRINSDFYKNTEVIKVHKSVDINWMAKELGISAQKFKELNPELTHNAIPYIPKHGLSLRVPSGKQQQMVAKIQSYKERSNHNISSYTVKSGDNLTKISRKFNITIAELKNINRMNKNTVYIGQKLRVPSSVASHNSIDQAPTRYQVHRIQRGDNLYSLARRYHTSLSEIMKLNNIKKKTIYIGQKLKVPADERTYYIVRSGDYLEKIAQRHGVSVNQIKSLNTMRSSKIFPGQKLVVKVD